MDMYPRTEKMTNPAKKLVTQLMVLVASASLYTTAYHCCRSMTITYFLRIIARTINFQLIPTYPSAYKKLLDTPLAMTIVEH